MGSPFARTLKEGHSVGALARQQRRFAWDHGLAIFLSFGKWSWLFYRFYESISE